MTISTQFAMRIIPMNDQIEIIKEENKNKMIKTILQDINTDPEALTGSIF